MTGLLASAGLLHVSLLIDALTFGVSLLTLAAVRRGYAAGSRPGRPGRPGRPAVTARALLREVGEGIRALAATRLLRTLMLFILVLNFCLGADKLIIFLARSTMHLPAGQVGLVVTAGGAGGVLGAAAASVLARRRGALAVIALFSGLSGAALLGMSAARSMPVLLAANLLYIGAIVAASVALRSLRQAVVSRAVLGRVTASWRLGGQAVTLLGGVLAGVLAAVSGSPGRCSPWRGC